ncbi:MAG: hypothetical protein AB1760_00055 [Pseudomonadota bacterium]
MPEVTTLGTNELFCFSFPTNEQASAYSAEVEALMRGPNRPADDDALWDALRTLAAKHGGEESLPF